MYRSIGLLQTTCVLEFLYMVSGGRERQGRRKDKGRSTKNEGEVKTEGGSRSDAVKGRRLIRTSCVLANQR